MKSYTVIHRRITRGIALRGSTILLGGTAARQTSARIDIDAIRPPAMDGDLVVDAAASKIGERVTLSAPAPDERALVLISTEGAATRASGGSVEPYWGAPVQIARGTLNHPANHALAGWDETLWILAPGEAVMVLAAGGKAGGPAYLVCWDGASLTISAPADWIASTMPAWLGTATDEERTARIATARSRRHAKLATAIEQGLSAVAL